MSDFEIGEPLPPPSARPKLRPWHVMLGGSVLAILGLTLWINRSPREPGHGDKTDIGRNTGLNDGPGVGLSASTRRMIEDALASGRFPAAAAAAPHVDMPERGRRAFVIVAPASGSLEMSDRPTFRWTRLPGDATYQVAVFDTGLKEVARSGRIKETEWRPAQPLPREQSLIWQVSADSRGKRTTAPLPPEPFPVFRIAPETVAREIETERAAAHPSRLALALLYARYGARDQAADELDKLATQNPDSELVQSLARSFKGGPPDRTQP